MLPDFPSIKDKLLKISTLLIKHKIKSNSPILSQSKNIRYFEGNRMKVIYENGEEDISTFKTLRAERSMDSKEIIEGGYNFIAEVDEGIAQEMQRKQELLLFEAIDESVKKNGNDIDAGGRELTQEMLLELYEKLDYTFDGYGNPTSNYAFYVSPNDYEKLKMKLEVIEKDIEFTERYNALMEQKKKEYYDRESNRKLVD